MTWKPKPGIVIHRKITWLLLFSIFSLAVASWLIYVGKENIQRTNDRINQTYEEISAAQQLIISLKDRRITSDLIDTGRYTRLIQGFSLLRQQTLGNNDPVQRIDQLRAYVLQKSTLRITAADSILVDAKIGAALYSIIKEERSILSERRRLNEGANQRTAYGMLIGRALAFLFVAIVLVRLNNDITRRKTTQEQLVSAILEAQDAKQMQEQFLANMSHEIRTPMNGIKGMTDLLMDTPLSGRQQELTGLIKSSVNSLLVIINDILDFSKIKAGKLNVEKIDFGLKDVVANVAAIFDHRLKKKGLVFHMDIAADIPPQLNGDPHRLNQILTNLLGNAIKFTDRGQIRIRAGIQSRSSYEVVLFFTITDTGMGIPADSLPFIFDSFSQARGDISRRYGGTGLGLTICRQLLHLQGGDISATSSVGKGSAFHFHLPYGYNDKPVNERPANTPLHDYSNLLKGRSFLVAEDNEINQKLIDYVLRKAGGTVQLAGNGAEAISFLQQGGPYDLIIMDLQMPEMDGYTATRYIRNDLHLPIPIIAMTATAMKGEQLQCLESGMNEYMTKPFEFAELYNRISGLLS